MTRPDRDDVLSAVEAGIDAVLGALDGADPTAGTSSGSWRVLDLARHLEAIAGAYLLWTGSAVGGRVARMRVGAELAAYNELMLHRLPVLSADAHAERYHALAQDHVRLARRTWDAPMLETPDDVVLDVGTHAAVAAVEWHVHTWDLTCGAERRHRPDDRVVEVMTTAWDDVLAAVTGVHRDPSGDPWASILSATGRTP